MKSDWESMRRISLCLLWLFALAGISKVANASQGSLRYSVFVEKFSNDGGCDRSLGDAWATQLTTALTESGRFLVVAERDMQVSSIGEQARGALGVTTQGRKTAVRSQMLPAQLLVKGTITQCKQDAANQGGGLNIGQIRIGTGKSRTDIRANLQMIDASTGRVVAAKAFTATSQARKFSLGAAQHGDSGGFEMGQSDKTQEALEAAIRDVLPWLESQLTYVPWRGSVVKVRENGKVLINRGGQEGVAVGLELIVGESEVLRDPDTGEVLEEEVAERARLRVEQVNERTATCAVVSGDPALLVEGMAIRPVS